MRQWEDTGNLVVIQITGTQKIIISQPKQITVIGLTAKE
jgi:hypothetical protein